MGNTAPSERHPESRPNSAALHLLACANSFTADWIIRVKNASHVNLFILLNGRLPTVGAAGAFLAHAAARLTCNHDGYSGLWQEQMAGAWRETKPSKAWPVLDGDDERWRVRAAIDAVVADAFGLSHAQYEHVLSTFNHKSYPKASALSLAMFDELRTIGLPAFTRRHDPYWDIPLNETLPQPLIEVTLQAEPTTLGEQRVLYTETGAGDTGKRAAEMPAPYRRGRSGRRGNGRRS
jgi:hypothetical protein